MQYVSMTCKEQLCQTWRKQYYFEGIHSQFYFVCVGSSLIELFCQVQTVLPGKVQISQLGWIAAPILSNQNSKSLQHFGVLVVSQNTILNKFVHTVNSLEHKDKSLFLDSKHLRTLMSLGLFERNRHQTCIAYKNTVKFVPNSQLLAFNKVQKCSKV